MESQPSNLIHIPKPAATLVELLRWQAQERPDQLAYTFLLDGEVDQVAVTFAELDRQARATAAWLESQAATGERALLLYPPGLEYIAAFFGCLYAGVTAVPAYPPRLNRPAPRIQAIVADSEARFALTTSDILSNVARRFEHTPDLQSLHWLDTQQTPAGLENGWYNPDVQPETLAFLQYTSGSTSSPRGVMLSHANLLHNLEMIRQGFKIEYDPIGIIWLPSYHDMGLIGGILEPLYVGGSAVLMSPFYFLQRPLRWLEAITRYRGNITGAPNFAFDLCVDKITPEQKQGLDLSSLKVTFTGSEPVRAGTLERFAEAFAGCGFRRETYYPCYGLAEATLFVSGGDGPAEPLTYAFQRAALEREQVVEASAGQDDSQIFVSCGHLYGGQQLGIVDPRTSLRCQPGQVGEIWVSGASVARGYWNRPQETKSTFGAFVADTGEGPFLRTGDLGFIYDGHLFIAGRLKDLIIIRGSNHYPQDIELTVSQSHSALQADAGAAFSIQFGDEERLVVVQEVSRQHRHGSLEEVMRAIRRSVAENHDLQVHALVLIKPLSIPKTSSGKIQRHACKAAFLEGTLEVVEAWSASPV